MRSGIVQNAMSILTSGAARILFHIYLPSVLTGFGLGMLLPTLPILARSFDVAPEVAAQGITALLVGRTVVLFPAGYIVDHLGRRTAMVVGPLVILAGLLMTALTPWFSLVLAGQAIVGAGEGIWSLGREIAAVEQIRAEQRGRIIAAFFGISSAGAAIGPVLGGQLTDRLGYAAVFVVAGIFAAIVCAIGLTYRESRVRVRRVKDESGGRLFAFIAPGYRTTFQVLMFSTICAMMRQTLVQSLLPVYVVSHLGYSATYAGYLFGVQGIVQLLTIAPAGFISDKIGRKAAVIPAATLAGLAFIGVWLSEGEVGLFVSSVLLGISAGLAVGTMTSFTYDIVAPDARGSVQAFRRSLGEIGAFSGPIVGGVVAGMSNAGVAFLVFAPLHLLSALLIWTVARETLHRAGRSEAVQPRPSSRETASGPTASGQGGDPAPTIDAGKS